MSHVQYGLSLRQVTDAAIVVRTGLEVIGAGITSGQGGMFIYGKAYSYTDGATKTMDAATIGLSALNFFSPIKTPISLLQDVVNSGKQPVRRLERQMEKLDDVKITTASQETLEWFDSVKDSLSAASVVQSVAQDLVTTYVFLAELALRATSNQTAATNAVRQVEGVSQGGALSSSSDYAALFLALDAQSAIRVDAMDAVAPVMAAVRTKVDEFTALFDKIDFSRITTQLAGLERIGVLLEKLKVPLDIALNMLNPVKPLLDAIGLISQLVDSVVDFVVETLDLGGLLEEAKGVIADLLPVPELFDELLALVQPLYDVLRDMIDEALGVTAMMADLNLAAFGGGMGDALKGVTGWADDGDTVLRGDAGADILDALDGDDTIFAGAGNDIIVAGTGNDEIWGEGGNDFIHFNASFTEYELARERAPGDTDEATGDIVVSHVKPFGSFNSGVDVLRGLEDGDVVAFSDISFSGRELKDAFIGGSVLTGSAQNDLMFLNSTGTRIDGFYVAEGLEGDDRIFGSTGDDRLNGGAGDDVLLPGQGDDEALGGSGSDTFQVLEGAWSSLRIDLEAGTAFGQGRDRLVDIENVVAMPGQRHFVRGTDDANTIFTASGVDVVTGRGGDDVIRTGGDDDYIVGGAGADTIDGGTGLNVMISGSAAVAGISDTYIGGENYDVVAYTSSSNLIKFDISDQSDDPSILQQLKTYMAEVEVSGRVEIDGTTGQIKRFDAEGENVTTDVTTGVEGFVGSDVSDLLIGGPIAEYLHGAGGDDIIRTNGTRLIDGGDGDDLIQVQRVDGGATQLQIEGGGGLDRLELDGVGEARWFYKVQSAIALQLRALDISTEGEDLRNAQGATFSIKPRNIEVIVLGDYADHAIYEPGGSKTTVFELAGGDDRFDSENGFADVHAGDGNDLGNFFSGGGGIFRGGAGDDLSIWSDTTTENAALMGDGTDSVEIRRFKGHADGGDGFDSITFQIAFNSRIVADLALGEVQSFKGVTTNNAEQVDMTLEGFEQLIATDFNDLVSGSARGERIIGRDGRDTLDGGGGNDDLYGGAGDDTLRGGAGNDVLHGGAGQDLLDGGEGRDMASYAWTQPDGLDGAIAATGFGAVMVDLVARQATGAFGTDILQNIENVTGGAGDDALTGDGNDNLLSGGDGDDTLAGGAGDDVLITGAGVDIADGGDGDDRIVVGLGTKAIVGGAGTDTLDFGLIDGVVTVDFDAGTYTAEIEVEVSRWALLDLDGDGTDDSDGFEARDIGGVMMTPDDVFQVDPLYADDAGDLSRVLPQEGEDGFDAARIEQIVRSIAASGTFTGIETIKGALSDDRMIGGGSADSFFGGAGNDTMSGGDGQDEAQFAAALADVTFEQDGQDLVVVTAEERDVVVADVETLVFAGQRLTFAEAVAQVSMDIVGTAAADVLDDTPGAERILGLAGNDLIRPTGGADTIDGGLGNDTLEFSRYVLGAAQSPPAASGIQVDLATGGVDDLSVGGPTLRISNIENVTGTSGDDILAGDARANKLAGGAGEDVIRGSGGNDTLDGGPGADTMIGGDGGDVYVMRDATDVIVEEGSDGIDKLTAFVDVADAPGGIETIILAGALNIDVTAAADAVFLSGSLGNNALTGGAADNRIEGRGGDDTLRGGAGNDTLNGGPGSDTFFVEDAGDKVAESRRWDGTDHVISSVDFRMGTAHIETLELIGEARLGAGNGLMNTITGNAGDNLLDGGKNVDTLIGGAGDDIYLLRAPGDNAVELAGEGIDTVRAFRTIELDANIENLHIQTLRNAAGEGVPGVNGFGNNLDNTIIGNPFDNFIAGRGGNDTLRGQAGADTFVFDAAPAAANADTVLDFNVGAGNTGDRLYMHQAAFTGLAKGALIADQFAAGRSAGDANDRFVFDAGTGRLFFDADGAGGGAQQLIATFANGASVEASDIFVV